MSPPILGYPEDDAETHIHSDASTIGLGATLVQIQDGVERVIAYASRALSKTEKNYGTPNLECLAIVFAIKRFRPYIFGKQFKVVTDHHSLCHLMNLKDPNGQLARWAYALQPYTFEIVHKSGRKHLDADGLSRNPVDPPESDEETIAEPRCITNPVKRNGYIQRLCALHDWSLADLQKRDKKLKPIIDALIERYNSHNSADQPGTLDQYMLRDDVLYRINTNEDEILWNLVIPKQMRTQLMSDVHVEAAGHLGFFKTWQSIRSRYYWPSMYKHVREFCNGCKTCQFYNQRTTAVAGPMNPVPPPSTPFHRIGVDFIGPFPMTPRYRNTHVIVIIDHCSRFAVAKPIKAADAENAIAVIEECVIFRHSCPKEILVDQGSPFRNCAVFADFCRRYNIHLKFTATYHPNTNGVVERHNGTIKRIIAKFVNAEHKDWDKYVNRAVYAHNTTVHAVTGYTPYFLMHGREPYLPSDARLPVIFDRADDDEPNAAVNRMNVALRQACQNTEAYQQKCKAAFDLKHPLVEYRTGEKVLLANFTPKPGRVKKWLVKWTGPYLVVKKTSPNNYQIKDMISAQLKIVSVRHMKKFHEEYQSDSEAEFSECEDESPGKITRPVDSHKPNSDEYSRNQCE
jgi:transposase InsO family protein